MKTMLSYVTLFGVALGLYSGSPSPSHALGESNARAAGMGRSYTAVARNLDAVGWNPANLGLPSDRKVSIAIFSAGVGAGNDAFSLGDYAHYNGKTWSEATRQEILRKVPDAGLGFNTAGEVRALGVSVGRFAVRANAFGAGRGRFPKDPVALALFGNEADRVYRVDHAEGKAQAVWNLSVSGAYPLRVRRIKALSVGMTVRYLRGIAYFEVQDLQGSLTSLDAGWQLVGSTRARRAEGGDGFSIDLGAAADLNGIWTAGMALIQVGNMSWNRDAVENTGSVFTDSLSVTDLTDVNEFEDLFNPTDEERSVGSFGAALPTILRVGVARRTDRMLLALDWEQGLNNAPGGTTRPRISAGIEYLVTGWLPVRTGFSAGGRNKTSFSFGFGLGQRTVALDVALRLRKGIIPNAASGAGVATELKLGF